MIKLNYSDLIRPINDNDFFKVISSVIAKQYSLSRYEVLKAITGRDAEGSTQISDDFYLPHVDIPNVQEGLSLMRYESPTSMKRYALVIIFDSKNISSYYKMTVEYLMHESSLKKMRQVTNLNQFKAILERGDY